MQKDKRVWIESLPAPQPILHRCIELPLKSLTKGKYPYHHLRKDESHDQLRGVLGDLGFLNTEGVGFSEERHDFVFADSATLDSCLE